MAKNEPGDFVTVDEVGAHVEKLVQGWASVIRCKATRYGGSACNRIVMVIFRDFYLPSPEDSYCVWDSSRPMLCKDCATDLKFIEGARNV
ncbi:MAG: hypothetical protein ABSD30_03095 [Candidatus Binatus sp.]